MYTSPKEEERQTRGLYSHYKKLFISSFSSVFKEGFSHIFFKWPTSKTLCFFVFFFKELTSKKLLNFLHNHLSHKVRGTCPHLITPSFTQLWIERLPGLASVPALTQKHFPKKESSTCSWVLSTLGWQMLYKWNILPTTAMYSIELSSITITKETGLPRQWRLLSSRCSSCSSPHK